MEQWAIQWGTTATIILNSLGIPVIAYLSIVLEVLIIQFIRTKSVRH